MIADNESLGFQRVNRRSGMKYICEWDPALKLTPKLAQMLHDEINRLGRLLTLDEVRALALHA